MIYYFKHANLNEWVDLGFNSRIKGQARIVDNKGVYEGVMNITRENKAQKRDTYISLNITQDEVSGEHTLYIEKNYLVRKATTLLKNKENVISQLKGYNDLYHDFSKKDIEKVDFFINEMQSELSKRNKERKAEMI